MYSVNFPPEHHQRQSVVVVVVVAVGQFGGWWWWRLEVWPGEWGSVVAVELFCTLDFPWNHQVHVYYVCGE